MNPVEKLEAAIAKLEELRDGAFDGPWTAFGTGVAHGDHWHIIADHSSIASVSSNDGVDEQLREPTAELIVTLHRTIDAQLALLRLGLQFANITPNLATNATLVLADAILNEES